MKKIPTVFVRDENDRRHVTRDVTPGCEWVLAGEGQATRKYDGTCCLVRDDKLYKRYEVKKGKKPPPDFELADHDEVTGKSQGWVPVGDGPEDKYHRAAVESSPFLAEGTYELCGPKIQGNPEGFKHHVLIAHDTAEALPTVPLTWSGLRDWLSRHEYEGIVWHHPDGRMAKLKRKDFA